MNEVNRQVPFSKRTLWTIRIVLLGLVVSWFSLGIYLHYQAKASRAKVEQNRIEQSRRNEFLRRGAQYRQELEEFNQGVHSHNAFD